MVPGPELLGGAAEGGWAEWTRPCPPASQPPEVHLSTPPGPLPEAPCQWPEQPLPLPKPLCPLGSFCVIYFLRRVCIIFSYGCSSSSCWGLGVLFFWRAGVGGPFCHFASVEHLGSIKTVKPSQCTLNLESN